ncbi:Undecaprenyl-phosphate 4-deoxy-4-formamido-L-arabinose transferase [Pirellula sp. SH-Sr6A]|uniref:glycosyltransferase family 2 protein n=1 Tax=Pirellula sp. SH-Sr6A TaxID=1632865 RepID=UPI00078B7D6D|nr:glycosyltransferase family 2 protein [Pirellula sp. SH-Sr6A]AMV35666.1 Undecaprenyl-phosphate 4-deoxy-4-formamido-L-arabinose transferase [Pirellula sp. SH-Sr6A]
MNTILPHVVAVDASSRSEKFDNDILISVVMPCLNESRTIGGCINQAHVGCRFALAKHAIGPDELAVNASVGYEIIIADNGSTDGSQDIASSNGACVVHVDLKGYGAALMGGIATARGKYIVMGDSDCSYDFGEVPRFIDKLECGYELVLGNRFLGGIEHGAMPWHHRYIGNPVLSGIGRLLYRTPCRDWHCGLRGFNREAILQLGLRSSGMEFASEMVLRAGQMKLRMDEIPVKLHRDGRDRRPHLRSFRDGCRHLRLLFRSSITNKA